MIGIRPHQRLSSLDASFLEVETPTAHMHVGWVALFRPPDDGERPTFARMRQLIHARLPRVPRYRQKLAFVPFGLHDPVWVDDPAFDIGVTCCTRRRATSISGWSGCISTPLGPGPPAVGGMDRRPAC